jgi:Putative serine dehydratase domain
LSEPSRACARRLYGINSTVGDCPRREWFYQTGCWPKSVELSYRNRLQIGDKIRLVRGHCDPTVNLYDWYVGIRGNRVEQLWPITARGAVY